MATKHRYVSEDNIKVLINLIKTDLKNYLTDEQIQNAINTAIENISTIEFKKVESLPETGEPNYIYLVPNNSGFDNNSYDEYFWSTDDNTFEFMGTTQIDLTGYLKEDDFEAITDEEIEALWNSATSEDIEV